MPRPYPTPTPRLLLALLLLPLASGLRAQTVERSFNLELTPLHANARLSAGSDLTFLQLETLDSLERGRPGLALGLSYEARRGRLGYTTGLRYLAAGYRTAEQALSGGDPAAPTTFRLATRSHFLALPLEVNFYQDASPTDRFLFFFGLHFNYHLSTTTQRTLRRPGQADERSEVDLMGLVDYRRMTTSFAAGIGYDRRFGDRLALRLQPEMNFFLAGNTRRDEVSRVNRNYYTLGARLSLRWLR